VSSQRLFSRAPRRPARRGASALVAALLLLARPAAAHDFWIEPSSYDPAPDERVAVRLMVGEAGEAQPVRREDARIVRFALLGPAGGEAEQPILGLNGHDPAGWIRPAAAGPRVIVYTNTPARIELGAEKFESYLREEGLDAIVAQRAERGLSGQPARELYSRCAKALLDVRPVEGPAACGEAAARRPLFTTPVHLPLELVPLADPFQLGRASAEAALEPLPIALLLEGQPLAGALVHAMRLDPGGPEGETPPSARTDAAGRCQLALPGPGRWLIAAVHMRAAAEAADHDYETLWASLTFEAPAAAAAGSLSRQPPPGVPCGRSGSP